MLVSLKDFLEMASEPKVSEAIFSFHCDRDPDIVSFLNNRAIQFERLSKSRTYFLFNEEEMQNKRFEMVAYFTVAQQILRVASLGLSNRQLKELDGFSAKRSGAVITEVPVFLIGQLAKNDTCKTYDGALILEHALAVIQIAQETIGGRIVLVECRDIPKLVRFYERNGFEVIKKDADQYIQLIRKIV